MVNGGIFVTKRQTLRAKGMFMPTSLETVSKNEIHVFSLLKLFVNFACVILNSSENYFATAS